MRADAALPTAGSRWHALPRRGPPGSSAASSSLSSTARCRPCATFGLGFLIDERWNPVTEKFGALAPIYGTLVTSFIAMLIAVPVGLGIAIFLTELCPPRLRRPIGIAIELLAGIPSIIYGIWGLFVFAPFLQQTVQPALIGRSAQVPVLSACSPARPTASASSPPA